MKIKLKKCAGSVTAPRGFLAAGVFCNIKSLGTGKGSDKGNKPDLALIVSEVRASVAGMFTTNQVCAAPVKVCLPRVQAGSATAVVVNSGNANACTGDQGLHDAETMAAWTGRQLMIPGDQVLVGSTGRIGLTLPMDKVRSGIVQAAGELGGSRRHAARAAEAIMTSDSYAKEMAVEFKLDGKTVRLGGICKGAGMIHPGMSSTGQRPAAMPMHATMLCYLTTDAAIDANVLQGCLREATALSFNRITVDGDMSTNDTVLVLANGLAGNRRIQSASSADANVFQAALSHVCLELAKMIVRDGEGVHRVVTVRVDGAASPADADAAARAVANSALVKTSWHGGDPNWGRIIDALGYSSAKIVEDKVDIGYSKPSAREAVWSLKKGRPTEVAFRKLCAMVRPKEFDLRVHLNLGKSGAVVYASDLTEAYVEFNKGDVTDPANLGG